MQELNLPSYRFRLREKGIQKEIFDDVRHKFVALNPEEWVRQNFLRYLIEAKNTPPIMLAVEKSLTLHKMTKRTDIVVYGSAGRPLMIVECKAPQVKINQKVFEQIARYNLVLKVKYLVVTNGLQHYCARIDFENDNFLFLEQIPEYNEIS